MTSAADSRKLAVLAADDARQRFLVGHDIDALEALLAPGLTYVHSSAVVDDLAAYLRSLRAGRIRYLSSERRRATVELYGPLAIMHGHVLIHGVVDGIDVRLNNLFQSVWQENAAGWQMLAWASIAIPPYGPAELQVPIPVVRTTHP